MEKTYREILLDRTFTFSVRLIQTLQELLKKKKFDAILEIMVKQVIRSGTSIGANTTEAQAATSTKDFINFLSHALKSANETCYWLKLLQAAYKDFIDLTDLTRESRELANILGSTIAKLRKKL